MHSKCIGTYFTIQRCTQLYCTALHWSKQILLQYFMHFHTTSHWTLQDNTTLSLTTLHNTTLHYTTLHYTTLHYTTLHYTTLHYTTPHYTTLQYTTPQNDKNPASSSLSSQEVPRWHWSGGAISAESYIALEGWAIEPRCIIEQYSTVQYSTVQYSTVQYSTVQYNAIHCSQNGPV